jgi:hypothetical protein
MKNLLPIIASLTVLLPFSPVGQEMWRMACDSVQHNATQGSQALRQWGEGQQDSYLQWLANGKQQLNSQQQGATALLGRVQSKQQEVVQSGSDWTTSLLAKGSATWHSGLESIKSSGKAVLEYPANWWQELASAGEESLSSLQARQEEVQAKLNRTLDRWEKLPDEDIQ